MVARWLLAAVCVHRASAACAHVNQAQSSGWIDHDGVTQKFSLYLDVLQWEPHAKIEIRWEGAAIVVDPAHVYNAQLVAADTTASAIVVQLGSTPANPPAFQMLGTGTQSVEPTISCSTTALQRLPPPSPPGRIRCDLQPEYVKGTSWEGANPGENVKINFHSWRDAGFVRLHYWGQTGLQVQSPVHAVVHSSAVVNNGQDTLITLQLGTSCEGTVVDTLGVLVSRPGQTINCVPHRAETMNVAFNLRPSALHPPQISCHDIEPPPPPPPQALTTTGTAPSLTPAEAMNGGYAPQFDPPSPPLPAPPPPSIRLGLTLRTQADCELASVATVASLELLEHYESRLKARITIRPVVWSPGRVMVLGVSGTQLDLGDERIPGERIVHASLMQPEVDPTGRVMLFLFRLQNTVPDEAIPKVELTLKGSDIHLATLSCRAADPTPEQQQQQQQQQQPQPQQPVVAGAAGFIWFEEDNPSDIMLVSVAGLSVLWLLWSFRHSILSTYSGTPSPRSLRGLELATEDEDAVVERQPRRGRGSRMRNDREELEL